MREAAFVKRNQARWEKIEKDLYGRPTDPDRLAEIFIQLTDDLAFAQTQYPQSRVTAYLNNLASKVHHTLYRNRREDSRRFLTFWKNEVPHELWHARKELLYAFLIFILSIAAGYVSTLHDDSFARLILGDNYVNMTLQNIREGKPMAVYSQADSGNMFISITFNNIRVAFIAFAMGLLFSAGTGYILFRNGVMVGAFLAFFRQEGLLGHALPVIMLHGTIELSSIVVAGAAGFVLGNGFLFPGTYPRLASFRIHAVRGLKMVMSLVPLFVLAGFIESFITRYEFMPATGKLLIIGLSACLILFYFVWYPFQLSRNGKLYPHRISAGTRLQPEA
ncbi:MAG: membrane protein [Cyclobacteriaceae bacterium]|nr:MAG: membrane protein [Cyclobacteriaceae bacterium]